MEVYFNPRPREEGDKTTTTTYQKTYNFNPRPREEGDANNLADGMYIDSISIHALVKRATHPEAAVACRVSKFQSTPS